MREISKKHERGFRFIITVVFFLVLSGPVLANQTDGFKQKPYATYHALVVGISNYDFWPRASHAVDHAREVSRVLKQMDFNVTTLTDPTSRELKGALERYESMNHAQDSGLLFYFSGNGETRYTSGGDGLGFIIPGDCPQVHSRPEAFDAMALSLKDMEAWSDRLAFGHVLMVFDTTLAGDLLTLHDPVVLKALSAADSQRSRQVIIAGHADEPLSGQGWFKHFLIKGLKGEADFMFDGLVTGSELAYFIKDRVTIAASGRLHPQYAIMGEASRGQGDFIFKPFKEGPPQEEQAPEEPTQSRLFVKTHPSDARVFILNIKPKFENGMVLDPGSYHVKVVAKGFRTEKAWVSLEAGESKEVEIALGEATLTNSLGMTFAHIEPGRFKMGSRDAGDETPHRVRLTRGFFIQTTEVTVSQFKAFVRSAHYTSQAEKGQGCWVQLPSSRWKRQKDSSWKNPGISPLADDAPVTCVTWNDARAFVRWLSKKEGKNYDLPTEAEWEYACRAGTATRFAFGNCLSTDAANYGDPESELPGCRGVFKTNRGKPLAVGSLLANDWGLFDMHGNVSEWCGDWYGSYPSRSVTNPKGASDDLNKRVFRGGSWLSDADGCRSAKRYKLNPDWANFTVGFRVVMRP